MEQRLPKTRANTPTIINISIIYSPSVAPIMSDIITITSELKDYAEKLKETFDRFFAENPSEETLPTGMEFVYNEEGKRVPGVIKLCKPDNTSDKKISITGCIHHNEPAGLAAIQHVMEQWMNVNRPDGEIYLVMGGELARISEYLDLLIDNGTISVKQATDLRLDSAGHNRNRVEHNYLGNPDQSERAKRSAVLHEAVYKKVHGNLSVHSMSQDATGMIIPCIPEKKITNEYWNLFKRYAENMFCGEIITGIVEKLSGLPCEGIMDNGIVVEGGGPHHAMETLERAVKAVIFYIKDQLGFAYPTHARGNVAHSTENFSDKAQGYSDIVPVMPDFEVSQDNPLILIHGTDILERKDIALSDKARQVIRQAINEGRVAKKQLGHLTVIRKGDLIGITKNGEPLLASKTGFALLFPQEPVINKLVEQPGFIACYCPERAGEVLPDVKNVETTKITTEKRTAKPLIELGKLTELEKEAFQRMLANRDNVARQRDAHFAL